MTKKYDSHSGMKYSVEHKKNDTINNTFAHKYKKFKFFTKTCVEYVSQPQCVIFINECKIKIKGEKRQIYIWKF